MSQYPPPPDTLNYYAQPVNRRPKTVTVFAALAIVFGSLGTLASLCSIPQTIFGMSFTPNPVADAMRRDVVITGVNIGSLVMSLVLFIMLLWSGIGSLSLKPAARLTMLWYAKIDIVVSILQVIVAIVLVRQRVMAITRSALSSNTAFSQSQVETVIMVSFYGSIAFSILILIWPILILIFMNKPHVKAAFAGVAPAQPPQGYYAP